MKKTDISTCKWAKWLLDGLVLLAIIFIGYKLTSQYEVHALCLDDFSFSRLFEKSYFELLSRDLHTYSKFRPVSSFVIWMCCVIVKQKIYLFTYILWAMNIASALILYFVVRQWTKMRICSFFSAICFLVSRFAYYDSNQILGLMEGTSLVLAVLMLFFLHRYLEHPKENERDFFIAFIFYTLTSLSHERFLALYPCFIVVGLIAYWRNREIRGLKLMTVTILCFICLFVLRFIILGRNAMMGTNNDNILDTFSFEQAILFLFNSFVYLFGINGLTEAWMNGIFWNNVEPIVQIEVYFAIAAIMLLVIAFTACVSKKKEAQMILSNIMLILSFIVLSIIPACTTIRLELRWMYVPYVGFLVLISYMACVLVQSTGDTHILNYTFKVIGTGVILAYGVLNFSAETYYRQYWPNLYYWKTQLTANKVYDETVARYGDDIWGYDSIVLIGSLPQLPENFLEPYRPDGINADSIPQVYWYESADTIPAEISNGKTIVLQEADPPEVPGDITVIARDLS